jgi:transcriptional regulator with XRE-family HTH domain
MPRSPTPDQTLAFTLRQLRVERGETQESLAYMAGISVGTLGRIESGRATPSWDSVRRIIAGMGVSLSELASRIESSEVTRVRRA